MQLTNDDGRARASGQDALGRVMAAMEAPTGRRQGDQVVTAGPKARRTRRRIMDAALELFTRQGYVNTPVQMIIDEADVSFGTFYQYFRDRSDVLEAIVYEGVYVIVAASDSQWTTDAGVDGVYRLLLNFVSSYATNANRVHVWEQASQVDEAMAELRRQIGHVFYDAVRQEIVRAGKAGRCRVYTPEDADLVARALTGMVDRFCYVTYVLDPPADGAPTPERSAEILAQLWNDSIGLQPVDRT